MKGIKITPTTKRGEKALEKFVKELKDPRQHKLHIEGDSKIIEFIGIRAKFLKIDALETFVHMVYLGMAKHGCHDMKTENGKRVPVDFTTEVIFNG